MVVSSVSWRRYYLASTLGGGAIAALALAMKLTEPLERGAFAGARMVMFSVAASETAMVNATAWSRAGAARAFETRSYRFAGWQVSERAGTASLMNEVRQAIRSVNGSIPIALEGTMQDLYAGSLARTSFTLVMLAIAGGMALALGVIGIYGVIAYIVSQRTREIGIRAALGAQPRHLKRMFLLHGLALSGVGAVVGLVAAVILGRLMSSLLFGIGPLDPMAYLAALGVTLSAAALASYLPARRAAAIDPIETLRSE